MRSLIATSSSTRIIAVLISFACGCVLNFPLHFPESFLTRNQISVLRLKCAPVACNECKKKCMSAHEGNYDSAKPLIGVKDMGNDFNVG